MPRYNGFTEMQPFEMQVEVTEAKSVVVEKSGRREWDSK